MKWRLSLTVGMASLLSGCAAIMPGLPTLPQHLEKDVTIAHMPRTIRDWADVPSQQLMKSAIESIQQERRANHGQLQPTIYALALSGGGSDGAFGAGFLCGWSASGTRPIFKLVTGISTGSLIAPFAFLGPSYDTKLHYVYTHIADKNIYTQNSYLSIILSLFHPNGTTSLADSKPLETLIATMIDEKMLQAIAAAHNQGRRLLVGTTQLNAQRLVIWNMGEIAKVGTPEALALFRKVLLASASLPASFPPQQFEVMADGKLYQEMHVDGGVEAQVMLFENAIKPFSPAGSVLTIKHRKRVLYIIRNESVYPAWADVKPQLQYITVRSLDSIIKSQGIGDLYRLYTYAQRDGDDYNLANIPRSFHAEAKSMFDQDYMRKLFDVGYQAAVKGYAWQHLPPEYSATPGV